MEVEKLDRGMSEWMGDLLGADPGGAGAEKARRELEGIGGQYEYWRRVSEGEISRRESRGYIAMEGDEASLGLEALEEAGDGTGGSRLGGETEAGDGKRVYAPGAAERRVLPEGEGARVSQESSVSSAAGGGADEFVDVLSPRSRQHILHGDGPGSGGHLWPGQPGKTPFPQNWSGDKIVHEVGDIVTSPNTRWHVQTGSGGQYTAAGNPARWRAWEVRDGVRTRVVYEPATGEVITAFPDPHTVPTGALVP
ncbi:EndoU domain-containing protein [Pseudenhygromyxa sp. WMMC2535]|nr:EndoU domain-containing protein [Pseudenhygromyxa sp. WMMC2535]